MELKYASTHTEAGSGRLKCIGECSFLGGTTNGHLQQMFLAMYSNHTAGDIMQAGEDAVSEDDDTNVAVTRAAAKNVCADKQRWPSSHCTAGHRQELEAIAAPGCYHQSQGPKR